MDSEPSKPLITIRNVHVASCGKPPQIDQDKSYVGYFENTHGEQWVFVGDPATKAGMLYGGDAGWENGYSVSSDAPYPKNLVMESPEIAWLLSCLSAFSGVSFITLHGRFKTGQAAFISSLARKGRRRR